MRLDERAQPRKVLRARAQPRVVVRAVGHGALLLGGRADGGGGEVEHVLVRHNLVAEAADEERR